MWFCVRTSSWVPPHWGWWRGPYSAWIGVWRLPRYVSPDLVRALHALPTIGRFAPEGNEHDS